MRRPAAPRGAAVDLYRLGGRFVVCVAALVSFAMVVPAFFTIPVSFSSTRYIIFPPKTLSLRWYEAYFTIPEWNQRHRLQRVARLPDHGGHPGPGTARRVRARPRHVPRQEGDDPAIRGALDDSRHPDCHGRVLLPERSGTHRHGDGPGHRAHGVRDAVRHHHRACDASGIRPQLRAGRHEPGRKPGRHLPGT